LSRAYFLLVYCNSLLTALNIRDTIRERGHATLGISLSPIGESNSLSAANREVVWSVCLLLYCRSPNLWVRKSTSRPKSQVSEPTDISRESNPTTTRIVPHHSVPLWLIPTTPRRFRSTPSSSRDRCHPERLSGALQIFTGSANWFAPLTPRSYLASGFI